MTRPLRSLPDERLAASLEECGATPAWAAAVARRGPFADDAALCAAIDEVLLDLDFEDVCSGLAAVAAPPIGAGDRDVGEAARLALQLYHDRFGYPFVSAIAAPTADELLMRVRIRLGNDPEPESRAAREHLRRLVRARVQQLLDSGTT